MDSGSLPPPTETTDANGQKILTEYKFNKDDKKIKTVRTYKVTRHVVSKSVARRKKLPKFGDSAKDADGPNPHTTFVSEDINMQLITSKEEEKSSDAVLDPKSRWLSRTHEILTNNYLQINLPSVASVSSDISPQIVLIATLHRISRRFSTRNRRHRHRVLTHHRPSLANTFHPSLRISRRILEAKHATTLPLFEFQISPSPPPMLIWRTSRTNSVKSRRCIWPRTRTPTCARASLTFISTTSQMLKLLSGPWTASVTIT